MPRGRPGAPKPQPQQPPSPLPNPFQTPLVRPGNQYRAAVHIAERIYEAREPSESEKSLARSSSWVAAP